MRDAAVCNISYTQRKISLYPVREDSGTMTTLDLNSLVASLPSQQERKRRDGIEQRRNQLMTELADDPVLAISDPRTLNSMSQCMYVIRCVERGLTKQQIVDLFFGDEFTVKTITSVIGVNALVRQSKEGKWERTEKANLALGTDNKQ